MARNNTPTLKDNLFFAFRRCPDNDCADRIDWIMGFVIVLKTFSESDSCDTVDLVSPDSQNKRRSSNPHFSRAIKSDSEAGNRPVRPLHIANSRFVLGNRDIRPEAVRPRQIRAAPIAYAGCSRRPDPATSAMRPPPPFDSMYVTNHRVVRARGGTFARESGR